MSNKNIDSLEEESRSLVETVGKQIEHKIAEAERLMREAVYLSEQHGIPFNSSISQLGQNYVPESFRDKFSEVDTDVVEELTRVSEYKLNNTGWEESMIC